MSDSTAADIKKNRLSNAVAITVVILSVFLSVFKVKDDNLVQAMQLAKADAVDTWSEYQSKKIKLHLAENSKRQAELMRDGIANSNSAVLNAEIDVDNKSIQKYQSDLAVLETKAKAFEASYDAMNFHDDQFDMSDALTSLALAIIAVSILVERWSMFYIGSTAGAIGIFFGMAGFFGWNVHPNWLAALLS
jgi:hypothetical protein